MYTASFICRGSFSRCGKFLFRNWHSLRLFLSGVLSTLNWHKYNSLYYNSFYLCENCMYRIWIKYGFPNAVSLVGAVPLLSLLNQKYSLNVQCLMNFSVAFHVCWPAVLPMRKAFALSPNILLCDRAWPVIRGTWKGTKASHSSTLSS